MDIDKTLQSPDPDKTKAMHERMKALPDDQKMRFAINWRIPHSLFNVAALVWPEEVYTTLQGIDWYAIHKSCDMGNWSHGGPVIVQGFHR